MWREYEAAWYRRAQLLEEAERQRLVRSLREASRRPSLRAMAAGLLLEGAFALESDAAWRMIWERLSVGLRASFPGWDAYPEKGNNEPSGRG